MFSNCPVDAALLTPRARELAHPALPPALVETEAKFAPIARERWPLDPEHLLGKASEKTGLSDFGPDDFREALDRLCTSAEADIALSAIGRRNLYGQLLDILIQRLRFADLWKRHPEILDEPVSGPVIIVGLPRSGTTFLQQLLSLDPVFRSAPFWESLSPLPDHDPALRPPDDAPLIARARKNVDGLAINAPGLLALHQLDPMVAEEDIYLLGPGFATMAHEWVYILPSYAQWFAATDQTPGYLHFRKVIQTLQWLRGGRDQRWLLKCPQHMEQLGPLLTAFPDATIVETLRDPATACVSVTNLSTYGQRLRTNTPDPIGTGAAFTRIITRLVEAYVRDRPEKDARFAPVHFPSLMKEPMPAVEDVYAAAGLTLSPSVRAAMEAQIIANRARPGHGGSDYAAEDFGIDIVALRVRLAPYYTRFGVSHDARL